MKKVNSITHRIRHFLYTLLCAFKRRFAKPIKRYEVLSLMAHIDYVDERLEEKQNEGWEIAGDILTKNKSGWCGDTHLHIPMKRRV